MRERETVKENGPEERGERRCRGNITVKMEHKHRSERSLSLALFTLWQRLAQSITDRGCAGERENKYNEGLFSYSLGMKKKNKTSHSLRGNLGNTQENGLRDRTLTFYHDCHLLIFLPLLQNDLLCDELFVCVCGVGG